MPTMRHRTSLLVAVIAFGLLLAMVLAAGTSRATAAPASNGNVQWAYGERYTFTCSNAACFSYPVGGNVSINSVAIHVFVGAAVIFSQTNNSPVYTLSIQKTLYIYASAQVSVTCNANCNPLPIGTTVVANGTATAWYAGYAHANVTTASSVYVNGTQVPAIGLLDASSNEAANATGTFNVQGGAFSGPGPYMSGQVNAQAQATFSPSLGLVPTQVNPGLIWNSSSNYAASASGQIGYHFYAPCIYLNASGICSNNAGTLILGMSSQVPPSGVVYLNGQDWGTQTVTDGSGQTWTFQVISLAFTGALGTSDGVFLVPSTIGGVVSAISPSHVLGSASPAGAIAPAVTVNPPDALYYSNSGGHVGFSGSATGSSLNAYGGSSSGATPESVTQAQQDSSGFLAAPAAAPSSMGWLLPLIVIVVAVVVVVAAVMWVRRRGRARKVASPPAAAPAAAAAGTAPAQPYAWPPAQAPTRPGYGQAPAPYAPGGYPPAGNPPQHR